jgi:multidrug resistance efflux pump
MGTLYRLALHAWRAPDRKALIFRMLNDTIHLVAYERASLWDLTRGRPRLLGVSGQTRLDPHTPLARAMTRLATELPKQEKPQVLRPGLFPAHEADWREVAGDGRRILWMPILDGERPVAALWLERPAGEHWREEEVSLLAYLMEGYAAAVLRHRPRLDWFRTGRRRRTLVAALAVVLLYTVFLHPFRMRVIAPCRVVAEDPVLVTAPLEGVVEALAVRPGERVAAGEVLLRYDPRVPERELAVAEQQVAVIRAQLERATVLQLGREERENEIRVLEDRLKQEEARLALARHVVERLVVRSPAAGVVQVENPSEWRGRPVSVGEPVLTVAAPDATRLRIWIAEADRLDGLAAQPVTVVLDVAPRASYRAGIAFIANAVSYDPNGLPVFVAEAEWLGADEPPALGLRGTAVLRGERASLAAWLFRKPWAAVRRRLGW